MGFFGPMQESLLILLLCTCVSSQRLTFDSIPRGLESTAFTISLQSFGNGLASGERLWIHLPYFGGGYNNLMGSLALRDSDGNAIALQEADWDSHREILRLRTNAAGSAVTLTVSTGSNADGLGPLPPRGGIDGDWTSFAWLRRYTNCGGTEPVVCGAPSQQDTFDFVQRFATGFNQLPTKMIGEAGRIQQPTFTLAAAEGSTNAQATSNCITVTFVSSVTMLSLTNNAVFVTVSGLTASGSENEDNLAIYRNREDCQNEQNLVPNSVYRQSERQYNRQAGTLTLRLETNQQIVAHQVNVITFALNNPSTAQNSLPISIEASGSACLQDYRCASSQVVPNSRIPPTAITSSRILEARAPYFSTSRIFQSTSDPGVDSVIFVTLSPSENIPASNVITLSGLCGSNFNNPIVTLFSTTGDSAVERGSVLGDPEDALAAVLDGNEHEWNSATRELKLSLKSDGPGMSAGTLYSFGFKWRLVGEANAACSAMVAAGARFSSAAMTNVDGTFGTVADPQFTTLKIGQATTRPGVTNYICVTLQSNANFGSESDDAGSFVAGTITLSGLSGTAAVNNPSATVFRCPDGVNANGDLTVTGPDGVAYTWDAANAAVRAIWTDLPNTRDANGNPVRMFRVPNAGGAGNDFRWDADNARATLTINEAFTFQAGTEYVFALNLENGVAEQGCQSVMLSASSRGWTQSSVTLAADSLARALQDGTENGDACALKLYSRKFLTMAMAQQIPLAEEDNTFTVTLKPNVDLTSGETDVTSTVTITGLRNTLTSLDTLSYAAAAGTFLPDFGDSLNFDSETGELTALLATGTCNDPPMMGQRNKCMKAGFTYGFTFELKNPIAEQTAPNVQIGAVYSDGAMPLTTVTSPSDEMKRALRVIPTTEIIKTHRIGQTNAVPGQKNAICVTLATWIDIESNDNNVGNEFATVTISGLGSEWQTSTQDQNIWHPDTSGVFGDLPLSAGLSNLRSRAPAGLIGTETWTTATEQGDSRVHYEEDDGAVSFVMNNLEGETDYSFCFLMTNPDTTQDCRTISLSVSSPGRASSSYTMTQPAGEGCVGVVGTKSFPLATLRSATNVASAEPTLILEFRPNFPLTGGEVLEVSGLSSYVPIGGDTSEDRSVPVQVSSNGMWDTTTFLPNGLFVASSGALRLTMRTDASIAAPETLRFCSVAPVPTTEANWNRDCGASTPPVVYELMFDLQNQASTRSTGPSVAVSAAPGASQLTNPEFPPTIVNTGMVSASRRRMHLPRGRRSDPQNFVFTMETRTHLYGGETLVFDLPHYSASSSGQELFGVVSTGSDAFTTFESASDANDDAMGRAFFTNGYANMGLSPETRSGMTGPGLDGFLILADNDHGRTMHKQWFADPRAVFHGTLSQAANAPFNVGDYKNTSDIGATLSFVIRNDDGAVMNEDAIMADPKYRIFMGSNNLAGLSVMCNNEERTVLTHLVTPSNAGHTVHLFVENGFMSGGAMPASLDMCMLSYKQHVGVYTGMRGMVGSEEVVFKQGAGPLYFVSGGDSGTAPPYTNLQGKPYTVYSRLELVAKHGADVPAGTEITITVPGILFPDDTAATITLDTTDTIVDKTTMSMALVSPLAGATTLSAGMRSGTYSVELTEWRPHVGPAAYHSDFVDSLDGLYLDFFGAMSVSSRVGKMTAAREVEVNPNFYSASNQTSWNRITLSSDGDVLSDAAVTERLAGSRLILGMTASAVSDPRHVQLRVAVQMSAPSASQQHVYFLGPADGVFSPDVRNMTAPVGSLFRQSRATIEPLGVLGKGFSDGAFWSGDAANSAAVMSVDLLAGGSSVYDLGPVGNMIGGDSVQAVASSAGTPYQPASAGSDDSFIYQGPFQITAVSNAYNANTKTEPSLTYDTRSSAPPQVFGASIRAMVTLMQPEPLAAASVDPSPPPPPPPPGGSDPCEGVSLRVVPLTANLDLEAAAAAEQCGVIFDSGCASDPGSTDGGIGCFRTTPPSRGVLESISEVSASSVSSGIASTGLTTNDIVSKIVRVRGRGNLRFLLRFLFSISEQDSTGTSITDVSTRRRRLLQTCPAGKEYRVVELGRPVSESCDDCDATCSSPAECNVGTGEWTTMLVDTSICNPTTPDDDDDDDNTGVIIGSVVGGTLGLLALIALCFMLSKQQPAAKPRLVPVYLPAEYPVLPIEYLPAPAMIEAPPLYMHNEPSIYQSQPNGQFETYSGSAAVAIQSSSATPMMPPGGYPTMPAQQLRGSAIPMQPMGSAVPMYGM